MAPWWVLYGDLSWLNRMSRFGRKSLRRAELVLERVDEGEHRLTHLALPLSPCWLAQNSLVLLSSSSW